MITWLASITGDKALESPLVLVPLLNVKVDERLNGLGSLSSSLGRLPRGGLLLGGGLVLALSLPLASPGGRGGSSRSGRRSGLSGGAVVVVDSPHVVPEVPLSGEAMASDGALASLICAKVRLLTVSVHGMGLTLMSEKASSRRKPGVLATLNLAAVGLEVGINKLAVVGK